MDGNATPQLSITVSPDKLVVSAVIDHFAPHHPLTRQDIEIALETQGVDQTLWDVTAFARLLSHGKETILARGLEVEHGLDAVFTETFFIDDSNAPNIDTQDVAHYYQTKRYITVDAGDIVMRRVPALEGRDGKTVLGKTQKAKKGKNPSFKKYPGTEVSPDDPNILLATVKGHPIIQHHGVRIDETLTVPRADLKTGNINFDGSVVINGDVLPQVSVMATGDVFVKGTVENASIEAGNNIVIGGGVISESLPGVSEPPKITTKIKAGGEVHARFLTQTSVKATGDIKVQGAIINSETITEASLIAGERGGAGRIIGGETIAAASITANELGSVAYIVTNVSCGDAKAARERFANTSSLLHRRIRERNQMREILKRIKLDPAPRIGQITINRRDKINAAIKNINKIVRSLRQDQTTIKTAIDQGDSAFVYAKKAIYPKTTITVNGEPFTPQEERNKTKLQTVDGKLKIE